MFNYHLLKKKILFILVTFLIISCGITSSEALDAGSTTIISTPTISLEESTATLSPEQLAIQAIQTICLNVNQSYPELNENHSEPIAETFKKVMGGMGIDVEIGENTCDAILTIDIQCEALGASYQNAPKEKCYTGAICQGTMKLEIQNFDTTIKDVSYRRPPHKGWITYCPDPIEAPFEYAWIPGIAIELGSIWGSSVLVHTLGKIITFEIGPEMDSDAAAIDDSLKKIDPEEVPALIVALGDGDWKVRWAAARALGYLGPQAEDATMALAKALNDRAPEVRREAVDGLINIGPKATEAVPALLEALGDEEQYVRERSKTALERITGLDFEKDFGTPEPTSIYIPALTSGQVVLLRSLKASENIVVNSVAFSPDGSTLATGSDDGTLKLWDVNSGQMIVLLGDHTKSIASVAFSPDGKFLVSGGEELGLRIWDAATGKKIRTIYKFDNINCVQFSPDGNTMAVAGLDKLGNGNVVKIFDPSNWQEVLEFSKGVRGDASYFEWDGIIDIAISSESDLIAFGGYSKWTKLWVLKSGLWKGNLIHDDTVYDIEFSPDGRLIATVDGSSIKLWDVKHEELVNDYGIGGVEEKIAFSSDGKILIVVKSGKLRFLDVESGEIVATFEGSSESGPNGGFAIAPSGEMLAVGRGDGTVEFWEIKLED